MVAATRYGWTVVAFGILGAALANLLGRPG
jgi:hypothetical protein